MVYPKCPTQKFKDGRHFFPLLSMNNVKNNNSFVSLKTNLNFEGQNGEAKANKI